MSGEVLLPVSILKNAGLSEAVNRNVRRERRSVVIVEDTKDTSDPDSEDSALCLKEEDAISDTSSSSSGQGLDLAPLPGSIADREHRKWVEKAVPLSNNPYSKENITRRRTMSFIGEDSIVSLRSLSEDLSEDEEDRALSNIYSSLYKRDYYVQMNNNKNTAIQAKDDNNAKGLAGRANNYSRGTIDIAQLAGESSTDADIIEDSLEEEEAAKEEVINHQEEICDEMTTLSVAEEIRKLQKEINKVAVENVQFPAWKQQRAGARQNKENKEMIKEIKSKDENKNRSLNEKHIATLEEPKKKKVSYSENEVTVFTFTEEAPNSLVVIPETNKNRTSSRQINPGLHTAPADPPTAVNDHLSMKHTEDSKIVDKDDSEDVPVLPSVKELANIFKVIKPVDNRKENVTKKDTPVRIPAMLQVKTSNAGYHQQVHSITARSVPREFRESLKLGKPEATDSIFKLPEAKQWEGQARTEKDNIIKATVVYSSKKKSYSNDTEQGYSSEDSNYTTWQDT